MSDVRRPVVAGTFYPGSAEALASAVDELLRTAVSPTPTALAGAIRGVVVPHAGYAYSGPVAATAYALVAQLSPLTVAILGPSHFEPLRGLAVAPQDAWSTPLGNVPLDEVVRRRLMAVGVAGDAGPHRAEHSIEVQLPFLQRCLPGVPILPVAVGRGSPEDGSTILDEAVNGDTLLVVSTDLSHYHDAETARQLDERTASSIEALALDEIGDSDACGADGLRVALAWAHRHGYAVQRLDLRNSSDTAGDPDRVVGYGAFAIVES